MWSTSLPMDTSGIHLQTQKCVLRRTPAESRYEYLTSGKEYIEHAKLGRKKELGGKTGVLVGLDLPSVGEETEAGVQLPNQDHCLNQRRNI